MTSTCMHYLYRPSEFTRGSRGTISSTCGPRSGEVVPSEDVATFCFPSCPWFFNDCINSKSLYFIGKYSIEQRHSPPSKRDRRRTEVMRSLVFLLRFLSSLHLSYFRRGMRKFVEMFVQFDQRLTQSVWLVFFLWFYSFFSNRLKRPIAGCAS